MSEPTEFPPLSPRPVRTSEPVFNVPAVVLWLTGALALVYALISLLAPDTQWDLLQLLSVVPARYNALFAGQLPEGAGTVAVLALPLFTYAFLHGSLLHLGFNAIWLVALGAPIARRIGPAKFLEFFFLCSVLAVVFYIAVRLSSDAPIVGASGGISGLMGGVGRLMFAPKSYDPMSKRVAPLLDRRVLTFAVILTACNVLFAVSSFGFAGEGQAIAWQAHVGGFFAGLVLYGLFDKGGPRNWPPLYRVPRD